jgi:hypothetical protein
MTEDHYRCECGKLFFKTDKAAGHKVETGHKITHHFAGEVREAFTDESLHREKKTS